MNTAIETGAIVQYKYGKIRYHFVEGQKLSHTTTQRSKVLGIITDCDDFGDYRVVWSSGDICWCAPSELEALCK